MFCSVMKNQTKRLRVGCLERVPYLRMHATVIDMPCGWKVEVTHVLRSRTVTEWRYILSRYRAGTRAIREHFRTGRYILSRFRAGPTGLAPRAIRGHFKKDRKAKKKAKKLQKASEQ